MTKRKVNMVNKAKLELEKDPELQGLVYKSKSDKRVRIRNKFGGSLNMVSYSRGDEKMFELLKQGAKKSTLDMALQVGTFTGGDYEGSFMKILKLVLSCQALGVNLNIDVFDSDTEVFNNTRGAYVICNVAKSYEKLDFQKVLATSYKPFFSTSLFNGYSGFIENQRDMSDGDNLTNIGTFKSTKDIEKDLAGNYDLIGGNLLGDNDLNEEGSKLVNKILKISGYGR